MNPEEFEKQLQRHPIRPIPAEWRRQILNAASPARPAASSPSFLSTLSHQLSSVFWPSPKAWAGLAAVWLAILAFNFSTREKSATLSAQSVPPSPELIMAMREQRRAMARLVEPFEEPQAEAPKPLLPGPRGDCRQQIGIV